MANTYKDIVITPNKGSSTDDPKIVFSGGNTSVNTDITLRVYPDSNGTLSFEGSAGQLFSVTNDLTGSLFTVNDVSGIPSIEVDALGNVDLAPFGGNVGIGTSNPVFKLDVQGDARITGNLTLGDATTDTITVNAANFNLANNVSFDSGTLFIDKSNDRIGIGTTSPIAKLDVKASDGTGLYIGTSSVNYYDANVHVLRSTLQIERMRIDSGGNVGIGTNNPTAKLTINGGGITGQGTGLFVANGDITTSRSGGTTGAIYFGSDSATKFLYHDGTAYYFGSTGNVITPQGYQAAIYYDTNSNYYMDLDGGSKINNLQILGAVSATTNTAFYYDAALEVRELNLAGAQADIANCAPRIGMHWGGRVASQIVLESSGRIAIRNNPGNGYEAFAAGSTYIAGSLGVGTSPTGTPLTVSRANQGTITTFNGPTSSILYQDFGSLSYFWNNNSDLYFGTYTANTLYISTNSSARITVTSTGNIGIGTSSPLTRLHVGPKVADDAIYTYDSNTFMVIHQTPTSTTTLNDPRTVMMLGRQGTGGQAYGAAAAFNLSRYENAGTSNVGSRTRLDITLANDAFIAQNTTVMTLLSGGNVGIGTTSPGHKLSIGAQTGGTSTATPDTISIGSTYSSAAGTNAKLRLFWDGAITYGFGVSSSQLDYIVSGAYSHVWYSNGSERMRLLADGNLGIANTSPGHKLSVNGTAYFGGKITSGIGGGGSDALDFSLNDAYASFRVIRNNGGLYNDGMYIGFGNAGTGTTKIYGGGAVSAALEKFSNYTLEPGSFRAPIFYNSGDLNVRWSTNDFVLRGGSPTIWFRDTDHNSAMIHCNSNLLYILRGGTDTETWSQVNGVWPFYINLTNNDATFGGSIFTSLGSMYAKRFYDNDNTAYFVDPADTSVLNAIAMYGALVGRTDTAANVSAANDTGSMSIRGSTTAPATVSFHRAGAYAINMGLDTDNIFKIGGWSDGANTYRLQLQGPGGTHTFNGNVTLTGALTVQTGGGTITGGFIVAPGNLGTISSGTTTLSPTTGNYQYYTNNGAHTIAAPGSDCAIDVLVTNGASAGTITLSGFTAPTGGGSSTPWGGGDLYATTNAQRFLLMVRRINGISTFSWKALQ